MLITIVKYIARNIDAHPLEVQEKKVKYNKFKSSLMIFFKDNLF